MTARLKWIFMVYLVTHGIHSHTHLGQPQVWTGYAWFFSRPDAVDWTLAQYQGRISENVWLTREEKRELFN